MAKNSTRRRITVKSFHELESIVNRWRSVKPFASLVPFPTLLDAIEGPFHYATFQAIVEGNYTLRSWALFDRKMSYIEEIYKAAAKVAAKVDGDVEGLVYVDVVWPDHNTPHNENVIVAKTKKSKRAVIVRSALWAF